MEVRWYIFIMIIGSAMVTFLPRVIPLMVLSRLQLPDWGMRWLSHVPIAVMAALVGQELLMPHGQLQFSLHNLEILTAIPTFVVAIKTRSLLGTVVVGVLTMMVLRFVL